MHSVVLSTELFKLTSMTRKKENLQFTIKCMKLLKLWPKSEYEIASGIFTLKQIVIIIIPVSILLASVVIDFYRQVGLGMIDDITDATENILVGACMLTTIHYIICSTVQRKNLLKLLSMLNDFEKFGVPLDQEETEKLTAFITVFLNLYGIFTCVIYIFLPFFFMNECEKKHMSSIYNKNIPCGMFSHIWLPFRYDHSPMFELTEMFLIYQSLWFTFSVLSFTALQFGFVKHISCHIRNFKRLLSNSINAENPHDAMKNCIQYHVEIIRFCDHLSICFSQMSFVHTSLTAVCLSMIAFELIQADSLYECFRLSLHFIGWLIALFVICFTGQELIDESSSIYQAAYNTNWPDADVAIQKYVLLLNLRAQKPLVITTGPFGVLSLEKFLSILSAAYTYFTLLASTQ